MYRLATIRFGDEFVFTFSTLQDAAFEALLDLERSWACPLSIESKKGVVWRHGGDDASSYERLQKFSTYT